MRLYNAICAWLEAHAALMGHEEAGGRDAQLDALVETAHPYTSEPELHAGHREQPYYDDEAGACRRRPVGFHPNR